MIDDTELLRRYADEGSAEAFTELVRRNLDLVYAAALRHVGDTHRARDIAQTVFIDLARKARALRRHPALVSWLHTSTRYAALKAIRAEQRRATREQEAHLMQSLATESAPDWERLRPLLDAALHELGERDRAVVLLRYFRGLPFADVAKILGMNEGAARMRLERALDKLNALLARRGIRSTSAALGVALAHSPAVAAPAGLSATIAAAALQTGISAGGFSGAVASLLVMSKLKLSLAAVVVLAGLTTALVELRANRELRAELRTLSADSRNEPALRAENDQLRAVLAQRGETDPALAELAAARQRIATLKARPPGVTDADLHLPRNVGRATPAAAMETFCSGVMQGDLDLVASFVAFSDDAPANREAFMASFSPAVRLRYRTPERLAAAALFGAVHGVSAGITDPATAMQIVEAKERSPDEVRLSLWWRTASGREVVGGETMRLRADGWAMKPLSLVQPDLLRIVRERIDPATGDFVPPRAPAP